MEKAEFVKTILDGFLKEIPVQRLAYNIPVPEDSKIDTAIQELADKYGNPDTVENIREAVKKEWKEALMYKVSALRFTPRGVAG